MTELLTYLAEHKAIIVGATATLSEVAVVLINMWRKIRKSKKTEIYSLNSTGAKRSIIRPTTLLWAANPLNLFKSVSGD